MLPPSMDRFGEGFGAGDSQQLACLGSSLVVFEEASSLTASGGLRS